MPEDWLKKKGIFDPTLDVDSPLEAYENAEGSGYSHYVVIDVGKMGNKWEGLQHLTSKKRELSKYRRIHLIDGTWRDSASRLE